QSAGNYESGPRYVAPLGLLATWPSARRPGPWKASRRVTPGQVARSALSPVAPERARSRPWKQLPLPDPTPNLEEPRPKAPVRVQTTSRRARPFRGPAPAASEREEGS